MVVPDEDSEVISGEVGVAEGEVETAVASGASDEKCTQTIGEWLTDGGRGKGPPLVMKGRVVVVKDVIYGGRGLRKSYT